jgi:hypothetical protein
MKSNTGSSSKHHDSFSHTDLSGPSQPTSGHQSYEVLEKPEWMLLFKGYLLNSANVHLTDALGTTGTGHDLKGSIKYSITYFIILVKKVTLTFQ